MNELALFAGAGGGILGGHLLGWRTVCAVELDAYARAVLLQRQADGCLPRFPIWDDVRTFDGHQWRGRVQVVSGGFPCTDISRANANAEGLDGDKSGLWFEMARIIGEVRPDYALVENSPFLVGRGLERVVADLAELGYDARWGVLGATTPAPPTLENEYGLWPTPCAQGNQTGGPVGLGGGSAARAKLLEICKDEQEAKAMGCGKLNPQFAEWLLGWPINWTSTEPQDCGESATAKYQQWRQWHGGF